ncbi:MAG TPA: AraC family transcriptional regulator [Saprospiraceae bacterium]|nr:AraC family transcriptional regulator [Saprospiraceae bacterium]
MIIQPKIKKLSQKKLIGKKLAMSLGDNKTFELWKSFMPRRHEISNKKSNDMFSLQVYKEPLRLGDLRQEFEKWALVEVSDFKNVPNGMDSFVLESGLYAVFHYKGLNTDNQIFIYIFSDWLPNSGYELDDRPHFEILGDKYKNGDPNSEEEIWIPIKK